MTKKVAKKVQKKAKRGRRKKVIKIKPIGMEMDKIYAIISECQVSKSEQELIVDPNDYPVIENILKDCEMEFAKEKQPDGIHYTIQPPPVKEIPDEMFDFDEEMENELKDEGQCF